MDPVGSGEAEGYNDFILAPSAVEYVYHGYRNSRDYPAWRAANPLLALVDDMLRTNYGESVTLLPPSALDSSEGLNTILQLRGKSYDPQLDHADIPDHLLPLLHLADIGVKDRFWYSEWNKALAEFHTFLESNYKNMPEWFTWDKMLALFGLFGYTNIRDNFKFFVKITRRIMKGVFFYFGDEIVCDGSLWPFLSSLGGRRRAPVDFRKIAAVLEGYDPHTPFLFQYTWSLKTGHGVPCGEDMKRLFYGRMSGHLSVHEMRRIAHRVYRVAEWINNHLHLLPDSFREPEDEWLLAEVHASVRAGYKRLIRMWGEAVTSSMQSVADRYEEYSRDLTRRIKMVRRSVAASTVIGTPEEVINNSGLGIKIVMNDRTKIGKRRGDIVFVMQ
jgi:hypothetical protein